MNLFEKAVGLWVGCLSFWMTVTQSIIGFWEEFVSVYQDDLCKLARLLPLILLCVLVCCYKNCPGFKTFFDSSCKKVPSQMYRLLIVTRDGFLCCVDIAWKFLKSFMRFIGHASSYFISDVVPYLRDVYRDVRRDVYLSSLEPSSVDPSLHDEPPCEQSASDDPQPREISTHPSDTIITPAPQPEPQPEQKTEPQPEPEPPCLETPTQMPESERHVTAVSRQQPKPQESEYIPVPPQRPLPLLRPSQSKTVFTSQQRQDKFNYLSSRGICAPTVAAPRQRLFAAPKPRPRPLPLPVFDYDSGIEVDIPAPAIKKKTAREASKPASTSQTAGKKPEYIDHAVQTTSRRRTEQTKRPVYVTTAVQTLEVEPPVPTPVEHPIQPPIQPNHTGPSFSSIQTVHEVEPFPSPQPAHQPECPVYVTTAVQTHEVEPSTTTPPTHDANAKSSFSSIKAVSSIEPVPSQQPAITTTDARVQVTSSDDSVTKAALEAQAEQYRTNIHNIETVYDAEIELIHKTHVGEISTLKEQQATEVEALKATHDSKGHALEAHFRGELEGYKTRTIAEVDLIKEERAVEVRDLKHQLAAAQQALNTQHSSGDQGTAEALKVQEAQFSAYKISVNTAVESIQQKNAAENNEVRAQCATEIENLKASHARDVASLSNGHNSSTSAIENELALTKDTNLKMRQNMNDAESQYAYIQSQLHMATTQVHSLTQRLDVAETAAASVQNPEAVEQRLQAMRDECKHHLTEKDKTFARQQAASNRAVASLSVDLKKAEAANKEVVALRQQVAILNMKNKSGKGFGATPSDGTTKNSEALKEELEAAVKERDWLRREYKWNSEGWQLCDTVRKEGDAKIAEMETEMVRLRRGLGSSAREIFPMKSHGSAAGRKRGADDDQEFVQASVQAGGKKAFEHNRDGREVVMDPSAPSFPV